MKRRQFLGYTAGVAGSLIPIIGRGQGKPCPPPTLGVSKGTAVTTNCTVGNADADWLARSMAPGVVWAHEFTTDAKVARFANASEATPSGWTRCDPSDGIRGRGCLSLRVGGATTLTQNVTAATTVFPVADARRLGGISLPFFALMRQSVWPSVIGTEYVRVTSVNTANSTVTVLRGQTMNGDYRPAVDYTSGAHIGAINESPVALPFSPFAGDRGYAGTETYPDWATLDTQQKGYWRYGLHGNSAYWSRTKQNDSPSSAWQWASGSAFYIQYRCKYTVDAVHPENNRVYQGKHVYIDLAGGGSGELLVPCPFFAVEADANWGRVYGWYTSFGSAWNSAPYTLPQDGAQPGGVFQCTYPSSTGCFLWPIDEWFTLLYKVSPGKHNNAPASGRQADAAYKDTRVEIWIATQADIQARTGYRKVWDVSHPWAWSATVEKSALGGQHPTSPIPDDFTPLYGPAAFNKIEFSMYRNSQSNIVTPPVPYEMKIDQVVFSHQPVECPVA